MECGNNGILEEDTLGGDERLLVQGTQTRAPPSVAIWLSSSFHHSHIPSFQLKLQIKVTLLHI
jgi:hypothetical protein